MNAARPAHDPCRRHALAAALGLAALTLAPSARAERRVVDDDTLRISLDLPIDWIAIPRAEILEAGERARAAGASVEWTVRAAWQRVPHQRWFTLPHLLLESRPSGGPASATAPRPEYEVGQAGTRAVHRHRSAWSAPTFDARLTLLAWGDERELFDAILRSLRRG